MEPAREQAAELPIRFSLQPPNIFERKAENTSVLSFEAGQELTDKEE